MSRYFQYREFSHRFNAFWFVNKGDLIEILATLTDDIELPKVDLHAIIDLEVDSHKLESEALIPKSRDSEKLDERQLLQQLIEDITRGHHVLRALKRGIKQADKEPAKFIEDVKGSNFVLQNNYIRDKDGGLEYINKTTIKKQKKVLGYILKQMGQCLMTGRSIMTISLPVNVFEPRSILERASSTFGYAPFFLERGGASNDPLEQLKHAVTFWISTLHMQTAQEKPFDAIIGETFQGYVGDCAIYMEQILYEPQISCFQMYGNKFRLDGCAELSVDTSANSVRGGQLGHPRVTFLNNDTKVFYQFPTALIAGTAMGKRTFNYTGKAYAYDLQHKLYCEITFDPGSDWFSKKKQTKDHFQGSIWSVTDKFIEKLKASKAKNKELKINIKEKEDLVKELSKIEGSWLDYIAFDSIDYWKFTEYRPYQLINSKTAIPSDSTYRLDIINLKLQDEAKAQDLKTKSEDIQRHDAKLRSESEKKVLNKKKAKK